MSQVAIEITSILDNAFAKNLKYCCVCLRTEEERKLVEPEHFLKCLRIMRHQVPSVKTICYVCESESTRAYALLQAINFASIINRWVKDIRKKIKRKEDVPAYLDQHISNHKRHNSKWPLPEWWRRVRARSDLVQTEVLTVGSEEEKDNDKVDLLNPDPLQSPGSPPPGSSQLDSIVIIDDEDEISNPSLSNPPLPNLTPAPVLPPPAKPNIPPNLLAQYLTKPNTNKVSLQKNKDIRYLNRKNDNQTGYLIQPVLLGPDGNYHILMGNTENQSQFVNQENMKVLEVGPLDTGEPEINILGVQSLNDGIVKDADRQKEVVKNPVMSGRIDWEDKIPMDVISFVDASDPLINQSPQEPPKMHPPKPKRPKNDVIDLS